MAYNNPTTNYSWALPVEGGSTNDWGRLLNEIFGNATTGLDAVIKAISDVANAAMPKTGGEFTGDINLGTDARFFEDIASMSALLIDWEKGNYFQKTLSSGNNTITMNVNTGLGYVQFITFKAKQPAGGDATITWPAAVVWSEGNVPTLSTDNAGEDVFVFFSPDNGGTIYGAHSMQEPA